jgi:carboxymethylenebutenolidase
VEFIVYPGTGHAFANEENALGTHDADATKVSWQRAVTFLKSKLP